MSLVTAGILPHRVTIERDNGGTVDSRGIEQASDWQPLSTVPCQAWSTAASERVGDGQVVTTEDRRLIVQLGTDVTEADRLGDVTDLNGDVVYAGPMNVAGVIRYADHLELTLQAWR